MAGPRTSVVCKQAALKRLCRGEAMRRHPVSMGNQQSENGPQQQAGVQNNNQNRTYSSAEEIGAGTLRRSGCVHETSVSCLVHSRLFLSQ